MFLYAARNSPEQFIIFTPFYFLAIDQEKKEGGDK